MATKKKTAKSALETTLDQLNATYGAGSVIHLDPSAVQDVPVIDSGSIQLNMALGVGGYPRGRIVEIYGPESSGKTTLAIHAIAELQKQGGKAAFIDAEHAFDPVYAEQVGVNCTDLIFSQPDSGEEALEIAENLIRTNEVGLVVIDSVAALVPRSEIEGEMGDAKVGLQARLMSQAMRKLTGAIKRAECTVIFINQLREKIGVMFGNPETTTGGNALKFYASVRMDIRRSGAPQKDKEGQLIANHVKVKIVKNKVAPPFRIAEFDIVFGVGISRSGEIVDLGESIGLFEKSGAWYSYNGMKIGNGRANTVQFLEDNPEMAEELESKIMNYLNS